MKYITRKKTVAGRDDDTPSLVYRRRKERVKQPNAVRARERDHAIVCRCRGWSTARFGAFLSFHDPYIFFCTDYFFLFDGFANEGQNGRRRRHSCALVIFFFLFNPTKGAARATCVRGGRRKPIAHFKRYMYGSLRQLKCYVL